jgi:hypothetical protein
MLTECVIETNRLIINVAGYLVFARNMGLCLVVLEYEGQ